MIGNATEEAPAMSTATAQKAPEQAVNDLARYARSFGATQLVMTIKGDEVTVDYYRTAEFGTSLLSRLWPAWHRLDLLKRHIDSLWLRTTNNKNDADSPGEG